MFTCPAREAIVITDRIGPQPDWLNGKVNHAMILIQVATDHE